MRALRFPGRSRRPAAPPGAPASAPPAVPESEALASLRRRHHELSEQVAELHWDLGGLTYEMAIRDHFRLDVLIRRAATLQERDAELAEVQRLLRMEDSGSAGACPNCWAPHSRGAVYCWQCGTVLMERVSSAALPAPADSQLAATESPPLPVPSADSTSVG